MRWQAKNKALGTAIMEDKPTIAFLGLGVMGGPMAGHLARSGYKVRAFNRSPARAKDWQSIWSDQGLAIEVFATAVETARSADIVFTCVGRDEDVEEITRGPSGIFKSMANGAMLVDHTTTSAALAKELAKECAQREIDWLDAPVSGGQAGAENGQLAIMCGGTEDAMARARPVMDCYAKTITHVGPAGAGQTAKMANQMCIAGILGGLSEAVRLAQGAGLDLAKTYDAISGGAAQSWQMDNRWGTMTADEFEFGFAIDWMRKDLGYALDEAKRLGLSSPITALVDQFYCDVQAAGGNRYDTSALITRLAKSPLQD